MIKEETRHCKHCADQLPFTSEDGDNFVCSECGRGEND